MKRNNFTIMKKQVYYFLLVLVGSVFTISSCTDDAEPFTNRGEGWYYNGNGSADVDKNEVAYVNFNIENNLNVNGEAYITEPITIGNDVNLNKGKIVIHAPLSTSLITIKGNLNVNDTIIVNRGVLEISGELNNNVGVIIVSDSGSVIVNKNLNNSSKIIGMNNISYKKEFNNHSKNVINTPVAYNPDLF